jgi:hypothetical protein
MMGNTTSPSNFDIGQRVEWESQSNGTSSLKQGVVVLSESEARSRLPKQPRVSGSPVRAAQALFAEHKLMFDGITWGEGRVIVEVASLKGKNALYMPRLSNLRRLAKD